MEVILLIIMKFLETSKEEKNHETQFVNRLQSEYGYKVSKCDQQLPGYLKHDMSFLEHNRLHNIRC